MASEVCSGGDGGDAQEAAEAGAGLPSTFTVKYLGHAEARGLWGIKHTRAPVDRLVGLAKQPGAALPVVRLTVSKGGCTLTAGHGNTARHHPIDTVSYGVQDLVYTRVFSMIVVQDKAERSPFQCHAFVCESRQAARRVTYCLAAAFQEYSRAVRMAETSVSRPKRFAIDLRSPEDQEAALREQDSSEA